MKKYQIKLIVGEIFFFFIYVLGNNEIVGFRSSAFLVNNKIKFFFLFLIIVLKGFLFKVSFI